MSDDSTIARARMVNEQLELHGRWDPRVLAAMRTVPRHEFVPPELRDRAYDDCALPIGLGQTISQPYVVALMCQLAEIAPGDRVLEVGTGCGYQAAVLAELAAEVHTIEIIPAHAEAAAVTLARLGYGRVHWQAGDGRHGWPEAAPFDAILVAAATPEVPSDLLAELAPGGRLVAPVGGERQDLLVHRYTPRGIEVKRSIPVTFVPLTGS
jgi:protein-L-isoaspartate(D-aspartate) O-methyltransferase